MIEAELHVIGGKHSGQVIPLNRRKFLIGRETDCQLRPNSELVSRHHCVFSIDEYSVRLRDLGSTNGTIVNGERIVKEVTLVAGDHVTVGNLEFGFRVLNPGSASGDETIVSSTETVMEIPSGPVTPLPDTTSVPNIPEAVPVVDPATTQQIPVQMDRQLPVGGDTTMIAQPQMMPGQIPYQPMMPGQVGFPGQAYGGYSYQPQQPMPMYPQGYPQPMMPGYAQQPAPVAPVESVAEPAASASPAINVTLPDPSQTGAVDEPPKAAAQADSAGSGNTADVPADNAAADIIRQYTQRRPG